MNYKHTFTATAAKIIGSIMTIAFSLVAFAHGQNCTLLPGWSPSTLADGQSRTGYQVNEATYTQSCTGSAGVITCISGSVANGNIYKYPSCIPHTRANCTSPTGANHLVYKTLYKAPTATYTQTCQQLSQSLQCLNGVFTGVQSGYLYTYATCIDPNRAQCIDARTNSYKDHGEIIAGYTAAITHPGDGQTCATRQRTLTCYNGIRSGGSQSSLFTGCIDSGAFAGCTNPWNNAIVLSHGFSLAAYTSTQSIGTGTCNDVAHPLACINGVRSGRQSGLFSGCVQANTAPCPNIISGMGYRPHGSFITEYTQQFAFEAGSHYCTEYAKTLQCVNGTRSGFVPGLHTGCQSIQSGSCLNAGVYTPNFQFIYGYTSNQPTTQAGCVAVRVKLNCKNNVRYNDSGNAVNAGSFFPTCGNCIMPRGYILPEGQTIDAYSTILWSVTGQNYTNCSPFSGQFKCVNSMIQGVTTGSYTPSNFPYSLAQCSTGTAKSCSFTGGYGATITMTHSGTLVGYSVTGAEFPKTCNQNYSTQLTCINGIINGNRQSYKYIGSECHDLGGLVPGVDITINESPVRSGYLVAQGSSPEISILFKNRGMGSVSQSITSPGFLSCTRTQQNINVYSSNPITSFVMNSGSKLGTNIRIKSIFTQALDKKTIVCKINTSLLRLTGNDTSNDTWTGTFEVVKADRFDLALSRSIETISKNLNAAEGAKGAQGLQNFVFNNIMNVLVPLIIVIGILSAILGFYKIMFSTDDTAVKEGTRYIIFGVIGIIIIMSAKFIGQNVYTMLTVPDIQGNTIAQGLYNNIVYPFIKLAIYLVLGAMFVILVTRVITFLFGSDTDAQKKAGTLIGRNVISMLIIIGAKQIVEAIYGKQSAVTSPNATNLGEIGSGILADKNIPILYQVINYALGIASLVILVIIIVQTVKLLMKPDDPAQVKSIKNSLLYMFIGILVLGAGYLIVNFAIIN